MVSIGKGSLSDVQQIETLIAEYHASEGLTPIKDRITWLSTNNYAANPQAYSWLLGRKVR